MCGRYSLAVEYDALEDRFSFRGGLQLPLKPRCNIAPTQEVLTVVNEGNGNEPRMMKWGLIPFWAKDAKIGNRMINARAETVVENRVFRQPFSRRRCLVVADGFYEWKKVGKDKTPMRIVLRSCEPFGMAGLWETWKSPDNELVHSCTIITTSPNSIIEPIHNRMPVILTRDVEAQWLDTKESDTGTLRELLVPYSANEMEAYEVSTLVNASKNDVSDVIARIQPTAR